MLPISNVSSYKHPINIEKNINKTTSRSSPLEACCFIPAESCFLLAGAFGMQVWHFPVVETID